MKKITVILDSSFLVGCFRENPSLLTSLAEILLQVREKGIRIEIIITDAVAYEISRLLSKNISQKEFDRYIKASPMQGVGSNKQKLEDELSNLRWLKGDLLSLPVTIAETDSFKNFYAAIKSEIDGMLGKINPNLQYTLSLLDVILLKKIFEEKYGSNKLLEEITPLKVQVNCHALRTLGLITSQEAKKLFKDDKYYPSVSDLAKFDFFKNNKKFEQIKLEEQFTIEKLFEILAINNEKLQYSIFNMWKLNLNDASVIGLPQSGERNTRLRFNMEAINFDLWHLHKNCINYKEELDELKFYEEEFIFFKNFYSLKRLFEEKGQIAENQISYNNQSPDNNKVANSFPIEKAITHLLIYGIIDFKTFFEIAKECNCFQERNNFWKVKDKDILILYNEENSKQSKIRFNFNAKRKETYRGREIDFAKYCNKEDEESFATIESLLEIAKQEASQKIQKSKGLSARQKNDEKASIENLLNIIFEPVLEKNPALFLKVVREKIDNEDLIFAITASLNIFYRKWMADTTYDAQGKKKVEPLLLVNKAKNCSIALTHNILRIFGLELGDVSVLEMLYELLQNIDKKNHKIIVLNNDKLFSEFSNKNFTHDYIKLPIFNEDIENIVNELRKTLLSQKNINNRDLYFIDFGSLQEALLDLFNEENKSYNWIKQELESFFNKSVEPNSTVVISKDNVVKPKDHERG